MFSLPTNRRGPLGPVWLSITAHAIAAGVFLFVAHLRPVRVFNLPGTALGTHVELAYLLGRAPAPAVHPETRIKPRAITTRETKPAPSLLPSSSTPAAIQLPPIPAVNAPSPNASAPASAVPDASRGSDSWGSGAIEIALTTYSPSPAPDLSVLPHGVQGDVIVDVTIDPNGKVADLAVLHSSVTVSNPA